MKDNEREASRLAITWSCRAECITDYQRFIKAAQQAGAFVSPDRIVPDPEFPDIDIQFQSKATLVQLQNVLRACVDSHTMLDTLRQLPLTLNSLVRQKQTSHQ